MYQTIHVGRLGRSFYVLDLAHVHIPIIKHKQQVFATHHS